MDYYLKSNFLHEGFCEKIIKRASSKLEISKTNDGRADHRKSSGVWLDYNEDVLLNFIRQWINAKLKELTPEQYERISIDPPYVMKYETGGFYKNHHDFFDPRSEQNRIRISQVGQRYWTFLVYLNDSYSGGETKFEEFSVSGKTGKLFAFSNLNRETLEPDYNTSHSGELVTSGEKWIMSIWTKIKY